MYSETMENATGTSTPGFAADLRDLCENALLNMCDNGTTLNVTKSLIQMCNLTLHNDTCTNGTDVDVDVDHHYGSRAPPPAMDVRLSLVLYSVIFLLAVVGNILVIVTLAQNKRMRTVTNIFLLSLSVSDLIFALFCMPITIVGAILQNFIFGEGFCRILPYIQVVAVFVSVWTMVSLSMERYFAICRPLTSRGWQTKAHAYKLIGAVWLTGFILFIPTVVFTKLTPLSKPHTYKCRDEWPDPRAYKAYTTCLFSILMVIPLLVMVVAYSLIIVELWRGMQNEHSPTDKNNSRGKSNGDSSSSKNRTHSHPRSTSSNVAKRRVVKMLIVIVLLFFVCWMPSWCLNMWYFYDSESALTSVSALDAAVVKLLTYISSCVNPITYCFMNKKFRQGFLEAFGCCGKTTEAAGVGTYSAVGSTRLRSTGMAGSSYNNTTFSSVEGDS